MQIASSTNKNQKTIVKLCIIFENSSVLAVPNFDGIECNLSFLSTSISCKEYNKSNPATQNITPIANNTHQSVIVSLTATTQAIGANPKDIPKIKCAKYENRLKYE